MEVLVDPPRTRTLSKHLREVLRPYHVLIPVLVALVLSLGVAAVMLISTTDSDLEMLKSIAPDVKEELEKNSIKDVSNLLKALSDEHRSKFVISKDDQIIASSDSILGFDQNRFFIPLSNGTSLSGSFVQTVFPLQVRSQDPRGQIQEVQLKIPTPLAPFLTPILTLAIVVLFLSLGIAKVYAIQMSKTVEKARTYKSIERAEHNIGFDTLDVIYNQFSKEPVLHSIF